MSGRLIWCSLVPWVQKWKNYWNRLRNNQQRSVFRSRVSRRLEKRIEFHVLTYEEIDIQHITANLTIGIAIGLIYKNMMKNWSVVTIKTNFEIFCMTPEPFFFSFSPLSDDFFILAPIRKYHIVNSFSYVIPNFSS